MTNMFELLLDSSPFPIWIRDIELRYIYVNRAYKVLFQLGEEDIVGQDMLDVLPSSMVLLMQNQCLDVILDETVKVFEVLIKDSYKMCYIFPMYGESKKLVSLAGMVIDINERKETELKIKDQHFILQTIIDTIPNVIFYKDNESKYIRANKMCKSMYENLGVTDIIGKTELEINPDSVLAAKLMDDDRMVMETKEVHNCEQLMMFKDGTVECREVVKAPVVNENQDVIGIVGISRDVTERKLFEEKLKFLSYTDSLTQVYNRTYFEERIKELQMESNLPIGLIMGDVNGLKLINDAFGHFEGDQLLLKIAKILKRVCGQSGDVFRWGGDEFVVLIPNANQRMCELFVREIKKGCKLSDFFAIEPSISLGVTVVNDLNDNLFDALKDVEEKVYRHKLLEQNSMYSSMISSLQKTLETKSMETELHTQRMLEKALVIGEQLGLSIAELDELALATKLHDIGKIGISEDILLKPGKLTADEFEVMKTHTEKGYRIIMATNGLATVAKGVLCHHEKFDGTGYPIGLKGDEIPIISRIVTLVDAYDAMVSRRSYHDPLAHELAITEIKRCMGSHFDPDVVKIFLDNFEVKDD